MSTRRRDIRAERLAKQLARWMGHGTPLPCDDAAEHEPWHDGEPPADRRIPVGPLDVAPTTRNSESRT